MQMEQLDTTFNLDALFVSQIYIKKAILQPDGKILMLAQGEIYLLNTDGSLDLTFTTLNSDGKTFFLLPNGKILFINNERLRRSNENVT
jgi:hypothetical protein